MERENAWKSYSDKDLDKLEKLSSDYIEFISENKTERECVNASIAMAEKAGYKPLAKAIKKQRKLKAGDKVYAQTHGKALILAVLGTDPLEDGFNILGAHIDSPRLDAKQNPLYENTDIALARHALLWRHQEVPVGHAPAGHPWRHRPQGWQVHRGSRGRGSVRPRVLHLGPASPSGPEADGEERQGGHRRRRSRRDRGQQAASVREGQAQRRFARMGEARREGAGQSFRAQVPRRVLRHRGGGLPLCRARDGAGWSRARDGLRPLHGDRLRPGRPRLRLHVA